MNKLSSEYIVDIINQKMAMPSGSVFLLDQNFKFPNTPNLFITVGITNSFPMSSESSMRQALPSEFNVSTGAWVIGGISYPVEGYTNYDQPNQNWDTQGQNFDQLVPPQIETSQVVMQEWVQIDICSRNQDAMRRNWEVIAALNSFYSQQQQESNYFKINRLPRGPINTSAAEGGSFLNRYTITVPCFVWYRKEVVLASNDYYDDFTTRVDDEHTIGTDTPLIEFEINSEGIVPP